MSLLKLYRWQLVVETMPAFWVVKHLDVVEHISASILPGAVELSPAPLLFWQLEKAFRYRIVMAVAMSTHAAEQVVGF